MIQNSDVAETRSICLVVRQEDYSRNGKQRKYMFLFDAFQAHFSMLGSLAYVFIIST